MKREDDQELWDLLGHAAEPKISPFFARNVVRETRKLVGWGKLRNWLSVRRLLPTASVAVALIAVLLLRPQTPLVPLPNPESDIFANVDPQDYEVVSDLDDLLASDDNGLLEDSVLL
jgi:hypothetical protein